MASGLKHEKATRRLSLTLGLVISFLFGLQIGIGCALSFLIGGLWLSPDLDTQSRPLKRWGIFRHCWWPYRKLIPHRSFFSHSPIIGSTLRLSYLFVLIELILLTLSPFGLPSPMMAARTLLKLLTQNPNESLAILLGIEASAWLHIIQDGDPWPVDLRPWKRD